MTAEKYPRPGGCALGPGVRTKGVDLKFLTGRRLDEDQADSKCEGLWKMLNEKVDVKAVTAICE